MDAGTMSPFEHGEVFVLDDGGEVCVRSLQLRARARLERCCVGALLATEEAARSLRAGWTAEEAASRLTPLCRRTWTWATTSASWTSR